MDLGRDELMRAFDANLRDLKQGIDKHRCIVASILEKETDRRELGSLGALFPSKPREVELKEAIEDAIQTLERSRKSFKSKQLELLRKRLTQVLINTR